jgi:ubiquinone/menaquinone biosynthesis C-methylase UbiE
MSQLEEIFGRAYTHVVPFMNEVIDRLDLPGTAAVLDVGTGRGLMAIVLATRGFTITTGEPAGDHWADWQTNAEQAGVMEAITYTPFEAESLPFGDGSFDAAFVYGSLHHIEGRAEALRELCRCVWSGGPIVVFEPNEAGLAVIREEQPDHPEAADPREYLGNLSVSVEIFPGEIFDAFVLRATQNLLFQAGKKRNIKVEIS